MPFIETYTGDTFDPLNPDADKIHIQDIAHALSQQCRFAGHSREFYSVGEHSVRCSQIVAPGFELWALMHDASEAYLVDLPRPLKATDSIGAPYRAAEERLQQVICRRFGLSWPMPPEVEYADEVMLATEVRDLMHGDRPYWSKLRAMPLEQRISPWPPEYAERMFLDALGGAR